MIDEQTYEINYPQKVSPIKKKVGHYSPIYNPPLRTGFVDYQNPRKYQYSKPKSPEPIKEDFYDTKVKKYKTPRKLHKTQNIQNEYENPNLFTPSKTPNFFIKTRDTPEFRDFTDAWGEYLDMKHLQNVHSKIYLTVYYKKWKTKYSQKFVQRLKERTSANSSYLQSRENDSISVDRSNKVIDTIELLERARRTIDEMTSSSSWIQNAANSVTLLHTRNLSTRNTTTIHNDSIRIGKSSLYPDQPKSPPVVYPDEHYIIPVDIHKRHANRSLADSFSTISDESDELGPIRSLMHSGIEDEDSDDDISMPSDSD